MNEIYQQLENIGLNAHESRVYVHLLMTGEQAASRVSKELNLPRSTIRGTLDRLCEMNIIAKIYKGNTQFYSPKNPTILEDFLRSKIQESQNKLDQIHQLIPLISALQSHHHVIPKVRFYEGKDGVIEAFNHCLFIDGVAEILFFTSYQFLQTTVIRTNDDNFFIPQRIKSGIPMRVLVGKTTETNKMVLKSKTELRERKFIPNKYVLPGNIHIYKNYVAYFAAGNKEYFAVIVESEMIAQTMKALFEFMWETV